MNQRSIDQRRDNRDITTFTDDIAEWTGKENVWGQIIIPTHIEKIHNITVQVTSDAKGRQGELITSCMSNDPDFIYVYVINQKTYQKKYEIKTAYLPYTKFFTIKKGCLQKCLETNADIILVNEKWFVTIPSSSMTFILNNIHEDIYEKFSPNDISLRIHHNKQKKYPNEPTMLELKKNNIIKFHRWHEKAQTLIEKYKPVLMAKNKTDFQNYMKKFPELKDML